MIHQNQGSSSTTGRTATGGMAQPTFFEQPPSSTLADIAALTKAHLVDAARGGQQVRGLASLDEAGPMHLTFFPYTGTGDALGGTKYWGASAELQMPFWFLPKEVGLKGAVFADAGSLWDYKGPTSWAVTGEINPNQGTVNGNKCFCAMVYDDTNIIRSSVGVGLIWASPFGPLRFDYSIPITKGRFDVVQQFKFGGGTSF